MPTTPNYGLHIFEDNDTTNKFFNFRTRIAGTNSLSNFMVIDKVVKEIDEKVQDVVKKLGLIYVVQASYVDGVYLSTVEGMDEYSTDALVCLIVNQDNSSSVTININSLGNKLIMKYSSDGQLINLLKKDLRKNHRYLCLYDGVQFIAVGLESSDQVNVVNGSNNGVLIKNTDGTISGSSYVPGAANGLATLDSSGHIKEAVSKATDSENVTTKINGKNINDIFEINGTTVKNSTKANTANTANSATTATNCTNVTSTINGVSIQNIFESDGTTVKKATNATKADTANTANSANTAGTSANATNVTGSINGHNISNIFEFDGTTAKIATKATNATNVTTNINGHAISEIFESDGITVKNAKLVSGGFSLSSGEMIVSSTNLDTLTEPKNYQATLSVAQTLSKCPTNEAFYLRVINTNLQYQYGQIQIIYDVTGKYFTRAYLSNGFWLEWKEYIGKDLLDNLTAYNVLEQINGHNISSIFEFNGTTVKNATNAVSSTNANNATYAENLGNQPPSYYGKASDTVQNFTHQRVGSVNRLSGPASALVGKVKFTSNVSSSDTWQVNNVTMTAYMGADLALSVMDGQLYSGRSATFVIDKVSNTINFNGGASKVDITNLSPENIVKGITVQVKRGLKIENTIGIYRQYVDTSKVSTKLGNSEEVITHHANTTVLGILFFYSDGPHRGRVNNILMSGNTVSTSLNDIDKERLIAIIELSLSGDDYINTQQESYSDTKLFGSKGSFSGNYDFGRKILYIKSVTTPTPHGSGVSLGQLYFSGSVLYWEYYLLKINSKSDYTYTVVLEN